MSNYKNASVGFRLAFNYLKAERFVDTVNVSKQILEVYPDFPKVKTDLINKARAGMRAWALCAHTTCNFCQSFIICQHIKCE